MKATATKNQMDKGHAGKSGDHGTALPHVDWNAIRLHWADFDKEVRNRWRDLTEADLQALKGDRDRLIERIETRYHVTRAAAEKQVEEWGTKVSGAAKSASDRLRSDGGHKA